jgi:hypothetical protein
LASTSETSTIIEDANIVVYNAEMPNGAILNRSTMRLYNCILDSGGIAAENAVVIISRGLSTGVYTCIDSTLQLDDVDTGSGAFNLDQCVLWANNSDMSGSSVVFENSDIIINGADVGSISQTAGYHGSGMFVGATASSISCTASNAAFSILGVNSSLGNIAVTDAITPAVLSIGGYGGDTTTFSSCYGGAMLVIGGSNNLNLSSCSRSAAAVVASSADISLSSSCYGLAVCNQADISGTDASALIVTNNAADVGNIGASALIVSESLPTNPYVADAVAWFVSSPSGRRAVMDVDGSAQIAAVTDGSGDSIAYIGSINTVLLDCGRWDTIGAEQLGDYYEYVQGSIDDAYQFTALGFS